MKLLLAFFFTIYAGICVVVAQPDTLWSETYQYAYTENINCVRSTSDDGLVACGYTEAGPGYYASWILRADDQGQEIWSRLESGGIDEASSYIEPTRDGGFINCGETWSYSPYNDWDGFVRKLDADGQQEWARLIGVNGWADYVMCVREVPEGGYIATGVSSGQPFLWRLRPEGGTTWIQYFPYEFWEFINFVEPTSDGGFLVAAMYGGMFALAKTTSQGQLIWNRYYESPTESGGEANCVREDREGNIYTCGYVTIYPISYAWYVIKTDPDGNIIWDHLVDYDNTDEARELVLTPDGNIVVAGLSWSAGVYEYW